jgi:serine/threonine-protein kinase
MGEVYLANDTETGNNVAIKILPPELTRNEQYVIRFRREAHLISQLDHPNIVKVYEVCEQDGIHFIVMEYLDGPSLRALLEMHERLSFREAIKAIIDIAYALNFAHSAGIIHRDVKPDNILSDEGGSFKIMDFGIAFMEEGTRLTLTGSVLGTPEYMSPEQTSGGKMDQRTDIYSLGIVFYELLTGKVPFRSKSPAELMQMHTSRIPESAKALNPEIPGKLADVIAKMLEKKPANRYASFSHVINAINQALPADIRDDIDMKTETITVEPRVRPPIRKEKPAGRVRERTVLKVPPQMKGALALSIIINLGLLAYVLSGPSATHPRGTPAQPSFSLRGRTIAPPAASGEMLYIGAEDGTVYAYDLQRREERWTFKARDKIEAAPVAHGDLVYIGSYDHHVYALDAADGAERWSVNTGDIISATPILSDGILFVCTREGKVFALDAETGIERWHDDTGDRIRYSPSVQGDVLFVPSGDKNLLAYKTVTGKKLVNAARNRIETQATPVGHKLYYVEFDDADGQNYLRSFDIGPDGVLKQDKAGSNDLKVPLAVDSGE